MFIKTTYQLFPLSRTLRLVRTASISVLLSIALAQNTSAQWVSQGPGPNTEGQVEGITQRPVVCGHDLRWRSQWWHLEDDHCDRGNSHLDRAARS
jgi:hypothetical protein